MARHCGALTLGVGAGAVGAAGVGANIEAILR